MYMRIFLLLLLSAVLSPVFASDDVSVRVRILDLERPDSATFVSGNGPLDILIDGRLVATLNENGNVRVERNAGRVTVRALSVVESGTVITLRSRPGTHLSLMRGTQVSAEYHGDLEVQVVDGSMALINVVPLNDYVASVIPSEYPFDEIEGVKAQAVLVRTYALRSRGRFGTYDLVDHTGSQVYRGLLAETSVSRQAAVETQGEILTYNGQPIEAVYHSTSGGHTANNESIWDGAALPYLRARPDPYDHRSPLHTWTERTDRNRLLRALSRHYGFNVTGISVVSTSSEGRVMSVRLHGSLERVEQGNRFRLTVNNLLRGNVLKSTNFTMTQSGSNYVFSGRGFGHGVGMSQYGAREQARQGRSYSDILTFYYTGVNLERRDSFDTPDLLIAERVTGGTTRPEAPRPVESETTRQRTRRTGW